MGPTQVPSAPGGPHIGPINLVIRVALFLSGCLYRMTLSLADGLYLIDSLCLVVRRSVCLFAILAWMNNYIHIKLWDLIIHLYPNFNGVW